MGLFIGIDVGTSACRACAINERARVMATARRNLPSPLRQGVCVEQDAQIWWQTLTEALDALCQQIDPGQVKRIAVDGTSGTLLLCARDGTALTPGLMYSDARATAEARLIASAAPPDSAALGASSSLAKLLHLRNNLPDTDYLALHQADWLTGKLTGHFGISDENNALKTGYDSEYRRWPDWLGALSVSPRQLPEVVPPGSVIGTVSDTSVKRWGWPASAEVVAGTTDSTAGFIATGASTTGTAVTALGSTLVLKVLSDQPVTAARYGVYSHRLADRWLAGGASNAGGAVVRTLFSSCDIHRYTRLMHPHQPTGLDYYPLPSRGERFPLQDPLMEPRLEPRPSSDAVFFQGILESLARIEQRGYALLAELGAPYPKQVLTVGGGAANAGWAVIREQLLGVPVTRAKQQEAAFGAALLARGGQLKP
ncbi:MAG: FGGY-family carbohydrate kinase [Gammaproteobacteria bacterium]|nr:MAG: FGGY-family carbohydrate kinase [Gammaproteobacteria bacterium]